MLSGQLKTLTSLPAEMNPGTHGIGGRWGLLGEEKILLLVSSFETPDVPIRSLVTTPTELHLLRLQIWKLFKICICHGSSTYGFNLILLKEEVRIDQ
jgi:hypothetical protein